MSDYVLDTNICIYWLKGKGEIRRKVEQAGADNLKITIVTLAELKYGAYKSKEVSENLKSIDNFLKKIRVLPLDEESADRFGKIKEDLRRSGQIIEDFDILIASITLKHEGGRASRILSSSDSLLIREDHAPKRRIVFMWP